MYIGRETAATAASEAADQGDPLVEIICPACGHVTRDGWQLSHFRVGSTEFPCLDGCRKTFMVIRTGDQIITVPIESVGGPQSRVLSPFSRTMLREESKQTP